MRFANEQERLKFIYEEDPESIYGRRVYKKTCPVCGVVFHTKIRRQIVCNYWSCKSKWDATQRKAHRQRATYSKSCPICGQRFTAHREDAQCCSAACRQKAYRALHKSERDSDVADK